jgi:hypothetical protein
MNDPNFIEPTQTDQAFARTLTAANAASLFASFIGTGKTDLDVTAVAFSSFHSSSANGGGAVLTKGRAVVTIQYGFQSIPEPTTAILLGLGIGITILANPSHRRPRRTSASNRT